MEKLHRLLVNRNVELDSRAGDPAIACRRERVTRTIASCFEAFDPIRRAIVQHMPWAPRGAGQTRMIELLVQSGMVRWRRGSEIRPCGNVMKLYLRGAWLEEYVWATALRAGADAAVFSQHIRWRKGRYCGENEIDVIARKAERLLFVSCKAFRPHLGNGGSQVRSNLVNALHETDNLDDHFGRPGDQALLVTTSDLVDEAAGNRPRMEGLFGKALALDVHVLGLDAMADGSFERRVADILNCVAEPVS